MDINKKRSIKVLKQLGVSKATAYSQLVKKLLFRLVQENNRDICFRCGLKIEAFEDFSIEHKEPWEDRDAKLFWDLENISFSHRKCNRPHRHNTNISRRKLAPEGTAWCGYHKKFEPIESFLSRPENWNGLREECRLGTKEYNRRYREKLNKSSVPSSVNW